MSQQGNFVVFCAEQYKMARDMTGRDLAELFTRYGIWDYLYSCFEALHTTGTKYIINDIDQYIQDRGNELA